MNKLFDRIAIVFAIAGIVLGMFALVTPASARSGPGMPAYACKGDGKFHRTSNALFKKYRLMAVCDANYGASNIKGDDGGVGTSTSAPSGKPLLVKGCIASYAGDARKNSALGCRIGIVKAFEKNGNLYFVTTKGDEVKVR